MISEIKSSSVAMAVTVTLACLYVCFLCLYKNKTKPEDPENQPHYLISDNLKKTERFSSLQEVAERIGITVEHAGEILSKDNGLFGPFIIYCEPKGSPGVHTHIPATYL